MLLMSISISAFYPSTTFPTKTRVMTATTNRAYRIFPYCSLNPFVRGIRHNRRMIPTRPITIPAIILLHTIVRHMPIPSVSAPIIPSRTVPIVFPDRWIGFLFSIFLQTSTIIKRITAPITPITTPGWKAFHSGINAMHIPSAKKIPPIVPKIIATKLLFFMLYSLLFLHCFHLTFFLFFCKSGFRLFN